MAQEIITRDGEIIETATPDASNLPALVRAEIDSAIATAHAYPRKMKIVVDNIVTLATMDEATAAECIYALNRGGKAIRGPSIRMAEIIAQTWGNCRVDARVIETDRVNKEIVAEATFHDLQTNSLTKASVRRRISDKHNRLYNPDMIVITGNAACSIARRLETGTVWINEVFAFLPNAPFGGHKQSGIGVEHGVNGLLEYTNSRTVTSRKLAPAA